MVERAPNLGHDSIVHGSQHGAGLVRHRGVPEMRLQDPVGLDRSEAELVAQRIPVAPRAERQRARSHRLAAGHDRDAGGARPHVEQRQDGGGVAAMVQLVRVHESEDIDIDHDRRATCLLDDPGVLRHAVLARRDKEHGGGARRVRTPRRAQHLVVQRHLVRGKRHVLAGFPVD